MTLENLRAGLVNYVPEPALDHCVKWIAEFRFHLRITRGRHSKYGDYRPPKNGKGHIITVNHDLNKYAFLITYVHEVAHLATFLRTKTLRDPHGPEWKKEFKSLIVPLLNSQVFPEDLLPHVCNYINNPAATSCTDVNLLRALKKYNHDHDQWQHLEELEEGVQFRIRTGREFIKKQRVRKNFLCIDPRTNHKYTLNPLMEVQIVAR
jgi:predicted SprT family Zn-dependent metalloprotease